MNLTGPCGLEQVMAARRADPEGFDAFFDAHYGAVARSLALAAGGRDLAEEAAQEAFARALSRWRSVREMERPVGWVYVVAVREARRRLRRRGREAELGDGAAQGAGPDPAAEVVTRLSVRAALVDLPLRQREAVVLRYLAGLSVDETARAMGCAPGTVKSTVHTALAALRVELEPATDAEGGGGEGPRRPAGVGSGPVDRVTTDGAEGNADAHR